MARIFINEAIAQVGKEVELAGWVGARRDHGKLIFIDLKDRSGILQVVFNPQNREVLKLADSLRPQDVISIKGVVNNRPEKMANAELASGKVELLAKELEILNKAETPPFDLDTDGYEIGEENRLKYRYLDLRRERLQNNLKMRHKAINFIRDYLTCRDFTEVETPILTKSTPEGARDYVVPSRLQAGSFYALPQSPQQYKQLLMVSGVERYFQIARCFRDEDTRGDRQPEFTQLDIEMSFISQEYNSDKPDLRKDKNDPNELAFLWVLDFPAFEWKEKENRWDAVHHPFTMPQISDIEEIKKDPANVYAYQYDMVLNGYEIGGGSLRIHKPELLEAVFEFMGHDKSEIRAKFGHLLDAFKYGAPPHGGIASGLDRVLMILQNEPSIREVFSFPKTGDGRDLMMNSPSKISDAQLKELHISAVAVKEDKNKIC
ncbi:MAG: Aspartate-tRNA ligase [Candidatus Beckwithbacteria bacterium GW2011_GWA2_43_10]|uniref:Aspartate--tRNA(Asp/Asn) ligase n=1 Tax=Candidatus Beckwithbacteria bacterium GW2011_GWA2_43_10 TaxID=1618369 RepID=A0A0G1BZT2_9BACT|nr:MAG: Aspartate-tRNA ligase [Candidatus Beckwithbacteria bacterium GW2011_GWA2_43_10]